MNIERLQKRFEGFERSVGPSQLEAIAKLVIYPSSFGGSRAITDENDQLICMGRNDELMVLISDIFIAAGKNDPTYLVGARLPSDQAAYKMFGMNLDRLMDGRHSTQVLFSSLTYAGLVSDVLEILTRSDMGAA